MKVGGQILWNVIPLCETYKICCLMGKRPMKDVLGNHLKDRLFHLVHWLSVALFLWKISQDRRPWGVGDDGRIGNLLKKTQCERGDFPKEGEFIFPITDGRIKFIGGDQELRTQTLIRQCPIRGESHLDFLGESEGFLAPPQDLLLDAGEAIDDFWSMSENFICCHHVEPRVKL